MSLSKLKKLLIIMRDIQKKLADSFLSSSAHEVPGTKGVGEGKALDAIRYYHQAYRARIRESLDDRFEVLTKVLKDYPRLREEFIEENPSTFYSLDDYGYNFSQWLKEKTSPQFFVDLAKLEEALDFFSREDQAIRGEPELDLESSLKMVHGKLLNFSTSAFSLWEEEKLIDHVESPESVLIYYAGEDVMVKNLKDWEFALLSLFQQGCSLQEAMGHLPEEGLNPQEFQEFFAFLGEVKLLSSK